MRPESYLGRGFEPIAGKPFGWAWNQERAEIRAHLIARGWSANDFGLDFRVTRIQQRLNREHRQRWKVRQDAWRARQPKAPPAVEPFTVDELERLVDLFAGANDPVTAAIATKALAMLEARSCRD